jgi:hypothetical protein
MGNAARGLDLVVYPRVLLTYFMIRWLQRRSDKNLDKLG